VQAVRSAIRGEYAPLDEVGEAQRAGGVAFGGWRQGFLSNITNPKVLVFYLAVLPQLLPPGAGIPVVLVFALSHALLGLVYLLTLTVTLHRARRLLARQPVRRADSTPPPEPCCWASAPDWPPNSAEPSRQAHQPPRPSPIDDPRPERARPCEKR